MNHIKESNIHPTRRNSRHGEPGGSRSGYQKFACAACANQFYSRGVSFEGCPHCASRVSSSQISLPNPFAQNSTRPRQSAARSGGGTSRRRSAFPDAHVPVNLSAAEQIERQLPSIRDVPVLRRALDTEVPPVQDPGQHSYNQPYLSLRSGQGGQHDLPPLRSGEAAQQHNGGSEHQGRQVLPDPRYPYSQSRTYQDYHHHYDAE
ncbi:hypothetical protein F4782DRAFT_531978 [Xylaria castorea]|nr:hypothetical protein F4782DRAFT_531978 [Xylaria castorea]